MTEHIERPGDTPMPQPEKTLLALCPGAEFMVKYLSHAYGDDKFDGHLRCHRRQRLR